MSENDHARITEGLLNQANIRQLSSSGDAARKKREELRKEREERQKAEKEAKEANEAEETGSNDEEETG